MDESRGSAAGGNPPDDPARAYIGMRFKEGASRKAIVQELIQRGYDPRIAHDIFGRALHKQVGSTRKAGLLYLIAGIAVSAASLGATIAWYTHATEYGGTYLIYCGLIMLGIYLTVRGVLQLTRGREVK